MLHSQKKGAASDSEACFVSMKALITGASSGIGRELAILLAEDNYNIIAVGRDEERLNDLSEAARSSTQIIQADLSTREACFSLYQAVKDEDIQIVVNCAGFGVFGAFSETDLGRELSMLDVNIDSLHILTKLFLKDFLRRNYGYILNVASAAAFMPGPLFSSYYASKGYVLRLTEAIHEELRRQKSNVYIGALCPGPVDTRFDQVAGVNASLSGESAKAIAEYGLKKMYRRKTIIVPGILMKLARIASKILPDPLMARFAYLSQRRKLG